MLGKIIRGSFGARGHSSARETIRDVPHYLPSHAGEQDYAILAGAMYAVGIEDTIMVKRIEKRPNKLVLLSTHKDYLPVMLNREFFTLDSESIIAAAGKCALELIK